MKPIDEVNILRYTTEVVQMYLPSRLDKDNGPSFSTLDEVFQFIRGRVVEAPVWRVHMGEVGSVDRRKKQVTLICRRRATIARADDPTFIDHPGRCVKKGTLDEVWPVFEIYVRML